MNAFLRRPRVRWAPFVLVVAGVLLASSCVLHRSAPDGRPLERCSLSKAFEFPNRVASWYDLTPGNVRFVASGRKGVTPDSRLAAHRTLPFGTWLFIRNPENGRVLQVEVLDRGPYVVGRDLDLSREAFRYLAPLERGLIKYEVLEVWIPAEK